MISQDRLTEELKKAGLPDAKEMLGKSFSFAGQWDAVTRAAWMIVGTITGVSFEEPDDLNLFVSGPTLYCRDIYRLSFCNSSNTWTAEMDADEGTLDDGYPESVEGMFQLL